MRGKIPILALALFLLSVVWAQSATLENSAGVCTSLDFLGSSTDPGDWYKDSSPNDDVRIKVCDVSASQVGGVYAMKTKSGSWSYVLITRDTTHGQPLSPLSSVGGNCYATSTQDLSFSVFSYSTSPPTYVAAFPGKIYAYTDTGVFIPIPTSCGYLTGSYSTSERQYDETTGYVHVGKPMINFKAGVSKYADDATFGVQDDPARNDNRRFVMGVCDSDSGEDCDDVQIISQPSQISSGIDLDTGIVSPSDTSTPYYRYVLINGLGVGPNNGKFCIGPNLRVSITNLSPNPVYFNTTLTINYTITNYRDIPYETYGGNVRVTSPIVVEVKIYNATDENQVVYQETFTFDDDLLPGDQLSSGITWIPLVHSGFYKVKITVDYGNNIGECNENDNIATQQFEVKPVVLPEIYINGIKTEHFTYAGRPYNLSIYLKNSDNDTLSNAEVYIYEEGGMNLLMPLQVWDRVYDEFGNKTKAVTETLTKATVKADYYGWINITIIPTGNKFFAPEYAHLGIQSILPQYKLYFNGRYPKNGGWEEFKFARDYQVYDSYEFYVDNIYTYENYPSQTSFINQLSYVQQSIDFMYSILGNFWNALLGVIH